MTPEQARNYLERHIALQNGKLLIWDVVIVTDYKNGQMQQWTFRGLLQIAYKLK